MGDIDAPKRTVHMYIVENGLIKIYFEDSREPHIINCYETTEEGCLRRPREDVLKEWDNAFRKPPEDATA